MMETNPKPVQTPLVSVLLCVFNGGKLLGDAVSSILNQTFEDYELIIVNDGSTDSALDSIRRIADPRIRIIDKDNSGLTHSLNVGIEHCRGVFIARQDADDLSCQDRLAAQVGFMQSHPEVQALGSGVRLIDDDGDEIGELVFPCDDEKIKAKLLQENQFVHGALMFRQSVLEAVDGYRETFTYAQDYDLMLRISDRGVVGNLPGKHYCLRFGTSRISIDHGREQRGFANLARAMSRQRQNNQLDDIAQGIFTESLEPYLDQHFSTSQGEVMLYLYCRSHLKPKIRASAKTLLRQNPKLNQKIKYRLIYLLSLLPGNWVCWIYRYIDRIGAQR